MKGTRKQRQEDRWQEILVPEEEVQEDRNLIWHPEDFKNKLY